MPLIDTLATLRHYHAHIAPIWEALPPETRGDQWARRRTPWGQLGQPPKGRWTIAAGYADAARLVDRPVIYVEHGAGQHYPGDERSRNHGAFSGGSGLDHVRLFLCPSETVVERWRAVYPGARAVAVGCPRVDLFHGEHSPRLDRVATRPLVAVTFHHDNAQIPEQHSALPHYRRALAGLRDAVRADGGELLGHGHPRAWMRLQPLWAALGVPYTDDLDTVLATADLLIGDNTSALPEAASCGIPLLWLNAPWYRRDVWHGGRFWAWPRDQVQCDDPADLADMARLALSDPQWARDGRREMVGDVYAHVDGRAAERAAAAILEVVGS